jgi:uncharacterized protein YaaQ
MPMQLILAVVQDEDALPAIDALTGAGLRVTRINTVGGFLRKGNATLLIGVEQERLPQVLRLLSETCKTRTDLFLPAPPEEFAGVVPIEPIEVQVGGATIFVLDVERYERL